MEQRPWTIPALVHWTPQEGTVALGPAPRIVVADAVLLTVAEALAEDLAAQDGVPSPVVRGESAQAGEILLMLGDCDARLGAEGYRLTLAADTARISARETAGVFYGTRTLLQLLRQGTRLQAGEALDWPRYSERGLMVDVGRKYFTPQWLEAHVRELAYLKLNYLHLHLSDNQGFRIESESHPEIVSPEHLSKAEIRALLALAERYHITVVPEIDMPGHMEAALAPHPQYQLANGLGVRAPDRLDVTNPEALRFVQDLLEEYLALFPGPYWHTGADELMPPAEYLLHPQLRDYARAQYGDTANGKDAIHGFVNWVDGIVRSHGRTTRMWHDDMGGSAAVTLNPDIVVEWWTDISPLSDLFPPTPQELLDRGHRVMNAGWFPTYYASWIPDPLFLRPDMRTAYESWSVDQFYGPGVINEPLHLPPKRVDPAEPRNLGSKLHIWNDIPEAETEAQIAAGIAPRLRVLAQKTWESPPLVSDYAGFLAIVDTIGSAPGFTLH